MSEYKLYRKKALQPMRLYEPGENLSGVSVAPGEVPAEGDYIAMNPDNESNRWLVKKEFADANYELAE